MALWFVVSYKLTNLPKCLHEPYLKNKELIESLLKGYEYLNEADVYFGKIDKINEYIAIEYSGRPTRIKLSVDNGETYDIPQVAKEHLNIEL